MLISTELSFVRDIVFWFIIFLIETQINELINYILYYICLHFSLFFLFHTILICHPLTLSSFLLPFPHYSNWNTSKSCLHTLSDSASKLFYQKTTYFFLHYLYLLPPQLYPTPSDLISSPPDHSITCNSDLSSVVPVSFSGLWLTQTVPHQTQIFVVGGGWCSNTT